MTSTFAGNRATYAGADLNNNGGALWLANSVLADAAGGANCDSTVVLRDTLTTWWRMARAAWAASTS